MRELLSLMLLPHCQKQLASTLGLDDAHENAESNRHTARRSVDGEHSCSRNWIIRTMALREDPINSIRVSLSIRVSRYNHATMTESVIGPDATDSGSVTHTSDSHAARNKILHRSACGLGRRWARSLSNRLLRKRARRERHLHSCRTQSCRGVACGMQGHIRELCGRVRGSHKLFHDVCDRSL